MTTATGDFVRQWDVPHDGGRFSSFAVDVATDAVGAVYVVDSTLERIHKFAADGTYITGFGSQGAGANEFVLPSGLAVDQAGLVYICERGNQRIQVFEPI